MIIVMMMMMMRMMRMIGRSNDESTFLPVEERGRERGVLFFLLFVNAANFRLIPIHATTIFFVVVVVVIGSLSYRTETWHIGNNNNRRKTLNLKLKHQQQK